MPEFVEAEAYRRSFDPLIGSTVTAVEIVDERLLRRHPDDGDRIVGALVDSEIDAVRRIGKVVLVDVSSGHTAALGFGLRGRLAVDGRASSPDGNTRPVEVRAEHIRLRVETGDGHELVLEDQLRLATLDLDPDEARFGLDVMEIGKSEFREILNASDAAVKSLLMDQRRLAGIGNLIADEILYQGKIDPRRPASELTGRDLDALWTGLTRTRDRVLERGGSHHGVLIDSGARERGAECPRCDVPVERVKVGGRTTYFCPGHQR